MRFYGIHRRAISQWVHKLQFCLIPLKSMLSKITGISPTGQWVKICNIYHNLPQFCSSLPSSQSVSLSQTQYRGIHIHSPSSLGSHWNRLRGHKQGKLASSTENTKKWHKKSVKYILRYWWVYMYMYIFVKKKDNHYMPVNTLRPRQNGRNFADDIFKYVSLNENLWISIPIPLKLVPEGLITISQHWFR